MTELTLMKPERFRQVEKYFLCFLLYSLIGWCYEVFLEVVLYGWGFSNRGVLFGPYCPVYGFGALALIFSVYRLIDGKPASVRLRRLPAVFLGSMLIATAIELAASYLCEALLGYWPWQTYVDYAINFQGRIALSPSVRFGLGGLLFQIGPLQGPIQLQEGRTDPVECLGPLHSAASSLIFPTSG